jgi:hypothetical protein
MVFFSVSSATVCSKVEYGWWGVGVRKFLNKIFFSIIIAFTCYSMLSSHSNPLVTSYSKPRNYTIAGSTY